jgi:hypothetical protein
MPTEHYSLTFPLAVAIVYLVPGLFYLTPVYRFCQKHAITPLRWYVGALLLPCVALPLLYAPAIEPASARSSKMMRIGIMIFGVQLLFLLAAGVFGGYIVL